MRSDGLKEIQKVMAGYRKDLAKLPKGEDFGPWQRWAVGKLCQGWGIKRNPKAIPKARVLWREARNGYEIQYLQLEGRREPIPGYLLLPEKPLAEPMPAALCIHGNTPRAAAEVAGEDQCPVVAKALATYRDDYARQLAQKGIVCLVIDQPFQGERRPGVAPFDPGAASYDAGVLAMLAMGESYLGNALMDQQWALNYLLARPEIDTNRVGAIGFSMGGTLSSVLAAVDDRIKCVVFSGYVTSWRERMEVSVVPQATLNYAPGLQWFDMPDLLAMAAPIRTIVVAEARDDPRETRWLKPARNAYRQLGKTKQLKIWRPPVGPHRFYPEPSIKMFVEGLMGD
jgi:dienelactone hydrolase